MFHMNKKADTHSIQERPGSKSIGNHEEQNLSPPSDRKLKNVPVKFVHKKYFYRDASDHTREFSTPIDTVYRGEMRLLMRT